MSFHPSSVTCFYIQHFQATHNGLKFFISPVLGSSPIVFGTEAAGSDLKSNGLVGRGPGSTAGAELEDADKCENALLVLDGGTTFRVRNAADGVEGLGEPNRDGDRCWSWKRDGDGVDISGGDDTRAGGVKPVSDACGVS